MARPKSNNVQINISIRNNVEKLDGYRTIMREELKKTIDPIYIDGSLTVNGSLADNNIYEKIIVRDSFTMNRDICLNGCIIALNGNVTLGNYGNGNSVTGKCGIMACSSTENIQPNNGGTITGGIISAGTLTMNGSWSIDASSSWGSGIIKAEQNDNTTEETTETVITNIRLVR